MSTRETITTLEQVEDNKFYRVADLKAVLKNLGLNYSIFSIMNAETWKCLNYSCGKRYTEKVDHCARCGSEVSEPIIASPRTRGGGKGVGHRRYSGTDIKRIVEEFSK